jgi:hypothetical protein
VVQPRGVRGPGINKWDLSLFKNFAVAEGVRLQFRARAPVRPENDALKGFGNSFERFFRRSLGSRQRVIQKVLAHRKASLRPR